MLYDLTVAGAAFIIGIFYHEIGHAIMATYRGYEVKNDWFSVTVYPEPVGYHDVSISLGGILFGFIIIIPTALILGGIIGLMLFWVYMVGCNKDIGNIVRYYRRKKE